MSSDTRMRLHAACEQVAPEPIGAQPMRAFELRRHGQVLPVERARGSRA